jgi:hypothetical protein
VIGADLPDIVRRHVVPALEPIDEAVVDKDL